MISATARLSGVGARPGINARWSPPTVLLSLSQLPSGIRRPLGNFLMGFSLSTSRLLIRRATLSPRSRDRAHLESGRPDRCLGHPTG